MCLAFRESMEAIGIFIGTWPESNHTICRWPRSSRHDQQHPAKEAHGSITRVCREEDACSALARPQSFPGELINMTGAATASQLVPEKKS